MAEGDIRKSDGDIYYASEYNKQPFQLGAGTLTVQTTTTSYGTDNADISIAASDLQATDMIIVKLACQNAGNQALDIAIQAQDVTAAGTIVAFDDVNSGNVMCSESTIWQDTESNDILRGTMVAVETTVQPFTGNQDTNDANVITTAWTLRITGAFDGGVSASDANVRWIAYVLRG